MLLNKLRKVIKMAVSSTYHQYGIEGTQLDPLVRFPIEINININSHLNLLELTTCCGVSKKWKKLASKNMFWAEAGKLVKPELPEGIKYKNYFDNRAVKSFDGIIFKLEKFLEGIPIDQKGRFTCQFLYNPQYYIRLEVGVGKFTEEESINDLNETCVFVNKVSNKGKCDFKASVCKPYITCNPTESYILKNRSYNLPQLSLESKWLFPDTTVNDINTVLYKKIGKLKRYRNKVLGVTMTIAVLGTAIIGKLAFDRL